MAQFNSILTNTGLAKISNAIALGRTITLTQMALGDGNGNPVTPTQDQTALVKEVYRAPLSSLDTDPDNPAYVIAELVVPHDRGGWHVREVGVFDDAGDLIAIANFPDTYKPVALEGSARDLIVRLYIEVGNAENIQLKVDGHQVIATRKWANDSFANKEDLASSSGADTVGFSDSGPGAVKRSVGEKLRDIVNRSDYASDADFNSAKAGRTSIDGAGRLRSKTLIAGDEELTGAARRDAVVVGRTVKGLTDCHAFADRTIIDEVTDYGGYGTFDATTEVRGPHLHNHVFSFQDRIKYSGSGTMEATAGLLSRPVHSGTGTIQLRAAVDIGDVSVTGGGTLDQNIGVYVRDLKTGEINSAVTLAQTAGHAIYANGGAPSYHKGQFRVGGNVDIGALISAQLPGGPAVWMNPAANAARVGGTGDYPVQIFNNADLRLEITHSGGQYAVRPGSDNLQPLGDVTRRWTQLYAGTATISTSDEREKQDDSPLDDAELRVAARLKSLVRKYRFKDAVQRKGNDARVHVGWIAQEVIEAFSAEGLDAMRYGIVCYDEWPEEIQGEVETTSDDPEGVARTVQVQKVIKKQVTQKAIRIIDGIPTQIDVTDEIDEPQFEWVQVQDDAGHPVTVKRIIEDDDGNKTTVIEPVMHPVPAMEEVIRYYKPVVRPAGNRYGLRYEELLAFVLASFSL